MCLYCTCKRTAAIATPTVLQQDIACRLDVFVLQGPRLDEITKVLLSHDSSGLFAAWHLAWIEVEVSGGDSHFFKCGEWIQCTGTAPGRLASVELQPVKREEFTAEHEYHITVKTAE